MRPWKHVIKIGDVIQSDDLSFEQKRDEVVRRLRGSAALTDGDNGLELAGLVEELSGTTDADEYDWVMDDIYDLADSGKWLWVGP